MIPTPTEPSPAAVEAACASVADPEFGLSIVDLGLIYDIVIAGEAVRVAMTLASEHCPAGAVIVEGIRAAVSTVPGVESVTVDVVWEPRWTPEMVSGRGREQLGWRET
jgi:metal-sulfur cluster biosynthetic enzyme